MNKEWINKLYEFYNKVNETGTMNSNDIKALKELTNEEYLGETSITDKELEELGTKLFSKIREIILDVKDFEYFKEKGMQSGVRIDIWTHLMRECIIDYVH